MTAQTNAERQAALRARRIASGLVCVTQLWVHPDDVQAIRERAENLAKKRERRNDRMTYSSDNATPPQDAAFRSAGTGFVSRFLCAACSKPAQQLGSGRRMVLGLKQSVCRACKESIDRSRA